MAEHKVSGPGWKEKRYTSLTPDDVLQALDDLKVPYEVKGGEAQTFCPYHEEHLGRIDQSIGSFSINLETGLNACWSCGGKGNFAKLVETAKGWRTEDVQTWLVSRGAHVSKPRPKKVAVQKTSTGYGTVTEGSLALFVDPPQQELAERRITREAAARYAVRWDDKQDAWVLPIRDPDGVLMGYQHKSARRVRNYPAGAVKVGESLFGWFEHDVDSPLIVVESPLDVVRLYSAGQNAVATFGASVSREQQDLLGWHAPLIVLGMDNDDAGQQANQKLALWLRGRGPGSPNPRLLNYKGMNVKDPGDMTDDECRRIVENSATTLLTT